MLAVAPSPPLACLVSGAICQEVVAGGGQQFLCLPPQGSLQCLETGPRRKGNEPQLQYGGNPPR